MKATCEIACLELTYAKTRLRTTMTQTYFDNLMILYAEQTMTKNIKKDGVIEENIKIFPLDHRLVL